MSDEPIKTNDVTISAVAVTIKCLKVNNRQMTQAVFTQLPRLSELVVMRDEDYEPLPEYVLRGSVWGWVNYCPKGEDAKLRQFIVERDGKLYRASENVRKVLLHHPDTHDEEIEELFSWLYDDLVHVAFAIVAMAAKTKADRNPCGDEGMDMGCFPPFDRVRAYASHLETRSSIRIAIDEPSPLGTESQSELATYLWRRGPDWHMRTETLVRDASRRTEADARTGAMKRIGAMVAHIEKLNKVRGILRNADQLFIAV